MPEIAKLENAYRLAHNSLMLAPDEIVAAIPSVLVVEAVAALERLKERVEALSDE